MTDWDTEYKISKMASRYLSPYNVGFHSDVERDADMFEWDYLQIVADHNVGADKIAKFEKETNTRLVLFVPKKDGKFVMNFELDEDRTPIEMDEGELREVAKEMFQDFVDFWAIDEDGKADFGMSINGYANMNEIKRFEGKTNLKFVEFENHGKFGYLYFER